MPGENPLKAKTLFVQVLFAFEIKAEHKKEADELYKMIEEKITAMGGEVESQVLKIERYTVTVTSALDKVSQEI